MIALFYGSNLNTWAIREAFPIEQSTGHYKIQLTLTMIIQHDLGLQMSLQHCKMLKITHNTPNQIKYLQN